jgi:hypothetical protein
MAKIEQMLKDAEEEEKQEAKNSQLWQGHARSSDCRKS